MWIKIVVFSLLTVVIARNVQYTDEDARRDILLIINYAFGHKNNESKNSRTNPHKHVDLPIEVNANQRSAESTKTHPKSNHARGKETFRDAYQRESVNSNRGMGYDRSQGRSNLPDIVQVNDKQTKVHNVGNKIYSSDPSPSTVPMNKLYTTPASEILAFTMKNEIKPRDRDFKTNKIKTLNTQPQNSTINVVSNSVTENHTDSILKYVVTVKNKEVTVKPQSKGMDGKKPDEDRWIWDDDTTNTTTTSTTPYVDDRAAFAADKCPTGHVKFGDKCEKED